MNVDAFLNDIRSSQAYRDQIVYVHDLPAHAARYADPARPPAPPVRAMLRGRGIDRLYTHQAAALDAARAGRDVAVVTGTASGKSLCYQIPILEALQGRRDTRALLLFPTKALCQDQFRSFARAMDDAGIDGTLAGVYDGDTPSAARRRLRDHARVLFSNPDMLHAALMPQHGRWASFLAELELLVLDELHVYSGIFGANMANLMRRMWRVCGHYGSRPQVIASSATIANPKELADGLFERDVVLVDDDGSPRGRRVFVLWNPPRERRRTYRSRRSANVEAHELMAELIRRGAPTITFSKAKMTAELIHRYVTEALQGSGAALASKVTPYRGGYLPEERREIERKLFAGELLGVSSTRALELGIDVGALEAAIIVGYPGTLSGFYQQAGRAGRTDRDALVVLIGLDTSINQYVMTHPGYLFERPIEQAVIDPDNPFVTLGHLRCATHELPLADAEATRFGRPAPDVLTVLAENRKVAHIEGRWYHAAGETPQHEVSLRDYADADVVIQDADTGLVLGQVNKFDAPPILHPGAIYMHRGDTYEVLSLDVEEKFLAVVRRVEVDYYTQPLGGTDVHHVDHRLREKPFGTGLAYWGEVTAYFNCYAFEKIHFYTLDAISRHELDLPTFQLETHAIWMVPPETLMEQVRRAGLDVHSGLRGIGYATRQLLPLLMTCDTLDFSHSIGSANSEWNAIFIYERYPLGLGFTEKAYDRLHELAPAVLDAIRQCPCEDGCPCCVGKPLRPYSTWNVERGEASIPSKTAALMILEGYLGDGSNLIHPDRHATTETDQAGRIRLQRAIRRRLERMREPVRFHPIEPKPTTAYPGAADPASLGTADVAARKRRRTDEDKSLRRRLAKKIRSAKLSPHAGHVPLPPGMTRKGSNLPPTAFPGASAEGDGEEGPIEALQRPSTRPPQPATPAQAEAADAAANADSPGLAAGVSGQDAADAGHDTPGRTSAEKPIRLGDSLAARAKRLRKRRREDQGE